jgi:hypothetical protein
VGLDRLPDQPTEEASLLHSDGGKWRETTTIKISGDKAFIPAFAGLGNVNLYVNNDGEIIASKQSEDPTFVHGMNDHSDVEFQGSPEEDDFLIHDGTAWRAKNFQGSNTMRVITQPTNCGNFSAARYEPRTWVAAGGGTGASGTWVFTVPGDLKFIWVNAWQARSGSGNEGYTQIPYSSITVDGVAPWAGWNEDFRPILDEYQNFLFRDGEPSFVVKDKIEFDWLGFGTANGETGIVGYFVEDK